MSLAWQQIAKWKTFVLNSEHNEGEDNRACANFPDPDNSIFEICMYIWHTRLPPLSLQIMVDFPLFEIMKFIVVLLYSRFEMLYLILYDVRVVFLRRGMRIMRRFSFRLRNILSPRARIFISVPRWKWLRMDARRPAISRRKLRWSEFKFRTAIYFLFFADSLG